MVAIYWRRYVSWVLTYHKWGVDWGRYIYIAKTGSSWALTWHNVQVMVVSTEVEERHGRETWQDKKRSDCLFFKTGLKSLSVNFFSSEGSCSFREVGFYLFCALRCHSSETRNLKKSRWLCNTLFSLTEHKYTHTHTLTYTEGEWEKDRARRKGDKGGKERENVILLHKIRQLSKYNQ